MAPIADRRLGSQGWIGSGLCGFRHDLAWPTQEREGIASLGREAQAHTSHGWDPSPGCVNWSCSGPATAGCDRCGGPWPGSPDRQRAGLAPGLSIHVQGRVGLARARWRACRHPSCRTKGGGVTRPNVIVSSEALKESSDDQHITASIKPTNNHHYESCQRQQQEREKPRKSTNSKLISS
jgi:hypothetical protein